MSEEPAEVGGHLSPGSPSARWETPTWLRRVGLTSWLFIGATLAVSVVIALLAVTRDITMPVAIGALLAMVFAPVVSWLENHGLKRGVGSALVVIALIGILLGAVFVTTIALADQSDALIANLEDAIATIKGWGEDLPIPNGSVEQVESTVSDAGPLARDGVATWLTSIVDSAAGLVAGMILGVMALYYLLKDGPKLGPWFAAREREPAKRAATERLMSKAVDDVQGYFAGKTALALVQGIGIWLTLWAMGVPGALAIGVVNFLGAYVPYIGAFVGGAFAVLMALGEGGIGLAVAAFAVVMVANLVLENLLEPHLLGTNLKMHPLTILLVTTLGGIVAGMIGLILAAPVYAIGLDLYRELKSIGFFDDQEDLSHAIEEHAALATESSDQGTPQGLVDENPT